MNASALVLAFQLGARRAWCEKLLTCGSGILLAAVILSYGELLRKLPENDVLRLHLSHSKLVWYLVLTQLISRSNNSLALRDVHDLVKSGKLEILLLRPVAFWPLILCEWAGQQSIQLLLLLPVATAFGYCLGGVYILQPQDCCLIVSCAACLVCSLSANFILGSFSMWVGESGPIFWVFQKGILIMGGALCPLVFYPHWLQTMAWLTPFPALGAVTGNFALGLALPEQMHELMLQIVWAGIAIVGCAWIARAMQHRTAQSP